MKKVILHFVFLQLLALAVLGQVPEAIKYQMVARDTSGNLLSLKNISLRIHILKDSMDGPSVYAEWHIKTTNKFGLVSLDIGKGNLIEGSFSDIQWGKYRCFLQTELDTAAGSNYQYMGSSELLAVPFALFAKRASPSHIGGSGIVVSGDTIHNTQPDQTVVLSASDSIAITGTYPSFTIRNTSPDKVVAINPGTAIEVSGSYPNFMVTNTQPDQTVVLSASDSIAITGTYPSFTIRNTSPDKVVEINPGTAIEVSGSYPNFMVTNTQPDQTVVLSASDSIAITGTYPSFTIRNTSPDKVVAINPGTAIEVSGSYPNFMVTNTQPDQTVVLSASDSIAITGTYPSFTIRNTSPDKVVAINPGTAIQVTGSYPSFSINNTAPDLPLNLNPGAAIMIDGIYPDFTVSNMLPDQVVVLNANTGIGVTGEYPIFAITNTQPDQTVILTNGSGISITGVYPSFTISNSLPNATHTGDATGNAALTVVKIQGRSVSATAPTTSYALKWTGTEWAPQTDATRDACPAGYTSINSQYCIQTNMFDWTSRNWFDAINICGDNGARLCSWAEWYNACVNGTGLSNMLNYLQWVDDGVSTTNYARVTGGTSCSARDNKDVDVSTNSTYTRCCFSK